MEYWTQYTIIENSKLNGMLDFTPTLSVQQSKNTQHRLQVFLGVYVSVPNPNPIRDTSDKAYTANCTGHWRLFWGAFLYHFNLLFDMFTRLFVYLFVCLNVSSFLRLFYYTYGLKLCLIYLFNEPARSVSFIGELLTISLRQTIAEQPRHHCFKWSDYQLRRLSTRWNHTN